MPIDPAALWVFLPAALALNLTPGADMMFCLGQGLRSGPKAGVAASFGIAIGGFLHTLLAGLGLAALIAAHPVAFDAIRWAGVVYLVWLAIDAWRRPVAAHSPEVARAATAWRACRRAVLVNLLNPKVAVFMLAFVPQFVDPARGSTLLQFLAFGVVFNVGGTVVNCLVGGFAGSIGKALARSRRLARGLQVATSFMFLGLAARLAFDRR